MRLVIRVQVIRWKRLITSILDDNTYSSATLYVPSGCLNAYKESYWKRFTNIVEE